MALREIFMKQWELFDPPLLGFPRRVKNPFRGLRYQPLPMPGKPPLFAEKKNFAVKNAKSWTLTRISSFRGRELRARLYGYLNVPEFKAIFKSMKSGGYSEKSELAELLMKLSRAWNQMWFMLLVPAQLPRPFWMICSFPQHCWVWMQ